MDLDKIFIYTDGACSGNPGPGGWGALLRYKNHEKKISGYELDTTNNQMEIRAVIEALKILKHRSNVSLYVDSQYLKNGITTWIHSWIKNNWLNSSNSKVKNAALWKDLYLLSQKHDIQWNWVKAHSGHLENEIADNLAVHARDIAKQKVMKK
ncbi:MAG: ribonuclease HI [Rickettsiaceae bacterium]